MGQRLYDTDFYAWTQQQAEAIREAVFSDDRLDRDYLAEEIESLGISQRTTCESYLRRIMEHLLKVEFVPWPQDVRGWRKEIRAFRANLDASLSPTLRKQLSSAEVLDAAYEKARRGLIADLAEDDVAVALPGTRPYSWQQITTEHPAWFPEPRYAAQ